MFNKEIVLLTPRASYYVGGGEKVPIKQAQELARLGQKVHLVTQKVPENSMSSMYGDLRANNQSGVFIHEVPIRRLGAPHVVDPETDPSVWNSESFAFASATIGLMKEIGPYAVLSYYLLDGLIRPHEGKNLVYLLGNPPEPLQLGIPMMRMYDADISISSVVKNHWQQYVTERKTRYLLPTGVELPKDSELKNKEPSAQVLFLGRLIERKGVSTLLHAFSKVLQDNPSAHLTIAGDGPMRETLERMTSDLQMQANVSFTGFVNSKQIQELFNNADLCVFPSYEGEGLLGVVLESMASAKAVIATTGNGNEDIICSAENGILVEPRNVEILAKNIEILLSHPDYAKTLGKRARQFVKDNLTWEQHVKQLLSILDAVNVVFR